MGVGWPGDSKPLIARSSNSRAARRLCQSGHTEPCSPSCPCSYPCPAHHIGSSNTVLTVTEGTLCDSTLADAFLSWQSEKFVLSLKATSCNSGVGPLVNPADLPSLRLGLTVDLRCHFRRPEIASTMVMNNAETPTPLLAPFSLLCRLVALALRSLLLFLQSFTVYVR